jgi:hypothetical protein
MGRAARLDPDERVLLARDVQLGVTLLAALWFVWGAASLALIPFRPFGPTSLVQTVVGAASLAFLLVTRAKPNLRVALAISAFVVVYTLVQLPWGAVIWCRLGRPWEAFGIPQLATVMMALVVPRHLGLGLPLVTLFAVESLFPFFYGRHVGLAASLPLSEPFVSIGFAVTAMGFLWLRVARRRISLRHIRAQAESEALRRMGPLFESVRDDLDREIVQITDELRRLAPDQESEAGISRMARAVARLDDVAGRMETLGRAGDGHPPVDGGNLDGGNLADLSDAERRLRDSNARQGALVFSVIIVAVTSLMLVGQLLRLAVNIPLYMPIMFAVDVVCLALLLTAWRRPSERRSLAIATFQWAAVLTGMTFNQGFLLDQGRPFGPLTAAKLLMLCMPLVVATRAWLSLLLVSLTAVHALVLYFALHMGAHPDLLPSAEPWLTMAFLPIGIAVSRMSEQRRISSIVILRDESDVASLHRRAGLFLSLCDQLNSPLQTLVLSAAQLDPSSAPESLARIRAAVRRLGALSQRLRGLSASVPPAALRLSLDARELELRT